MARYIELTSTYPEVDLTYNRIIDLDAIAYIRGEKRGGKLAEGCWIVLKGGQDFYADQSYDYVMRQLLTIPDMGEKMKWNPLSSGRAE